MGEERGGRNAALPRVWALLGHRTGDNHQVEALAEALGWPWNEKRLAWRSPQVRWSVRYGRSGPTLEPLTPGARARLVPPWPDLVLSAGWRSVPVARWIARESGARLVHLGRPRADLDHFDLVLTTPQYGLPDAPNVIRLRGPLSRLCPALLTRAAERWRDRFEGLPRPWIAVLVGGDAPPLRLTTEAAEALAREANAIAGERGGSLLVATGPRTGAAAAERVFSSLRVPAFRYRWGEDGENPYPAFLALADEFLVTADSVSMVREATMTGRPVRLFDLPERGHALLRAKIRADEWLRQRGGALAGAYFHLIRKGWIYPPRRPGASNAAIREGVAPGIASFGDETERAVAAVRRLFAEGGA